MSIHQGFETSRQKRRAQVFMSGELVVGGRVSKITIRDLSLDGAHISGDYPLVVGSAVQLKRANLETSGVVAWVKKNEAGIKFDFPLDAQELKRTMPKALLKSLGTDGSGK